MSRKQPTQEEMEEILGGPSEPDPFTDGPNAAINAEFEFDFSDSGEVADGTYHARVKDLTQGRSKANNPQYIWDFSLLEIGRSLPYYTALTPAARWKVAETLQAIGIRKNQEESVVKFKRGDAVGKPCRVVVRNDQWVGSDEDGNALPPRMIPKVINVLPPTQETVKLAELP